MACTASWPSSLSRPATALRISSTTRASTSVTSGVRATSAFVLRTAWGCLGGDALADPQEPAVELGGGTTSETNPLLVRTSAVDEPELEQEAEGLLVADERRKRPGQPAVG